MGADGVEEGTKHLVDHRQVILVRSALIGAASALPLPAVGEMLETALGRGLVYHVARLRYVDIDEPAVDALLASPVKTQRLSMLSALGGLLSLLRKRSGRFRRMFAGLAVLRALEEGSHAFHMATLLDHYCAKHHRGAAIRTEEAQRLRQVMDEATRAAQRELSLAVVEQLVTQGLRLLQAVPSWVWAQIRRADALPPLAAMSALAHEAQNCLHALLAYGYINHVVDSFDKKWSEGTEPRR